MKKSMLIVLAGVALMSCRQTGHSDSPEPYSTADPTEQAPPPVTAAPDPEPKEGVPNVVDTAKQDTLNDAGLKPKPKNEVTPPDISKPKSKQ